MRKDISYWRVLRQPSAACRRMLQTGYGNIAMGGAMLAGSAFTLLWADLWNLGRLYDTGQIMSVALVGGPILGLLYFVMSSFLARLLATTLSRRKLPATHIYAWQSVVLLDWIPVALFLWFAYFALAQPVFSPGSYLQLLWLLPVLPCIAIYAYHSLLPLRVVWGLEWLWSIVIFAVSWACTFGILLTVLSIVAGITLF